MIVSLLDKWKLYGAITADAGLSNTGKLVAFRLLDHMNCHSGQCNPSYETIGKGLGLSRRRAIAGVHDLEKAGWLTVERGLSGTASASLGSETNRFRLVFDKAPPSVISDTPPSVGNDTPPSVVSDTQTLETRKQESGVPTSSALRAKGKGSAEAEESPEFVEFYSGWPIRKQRSKALAAYLKARRKVSHATIMAGLADYIRHKPSWQNWAYPASWLNGGCWADEYGSATGSASPARQAPGISVEQWEKFVREFSRGGSWPLALGPEPGSAGCRAPSEALRSFSRSKAAA